MSQSLFYWTFFCNTYLAMLIMQVLSSRNPYFTGLSFAIWWFQQNWKLTLVSQSLFYWTFFCNADNIVEYLIENASQSLFYWTFFCNLNCFMPMNRHLMSQSLFYWTFFCNSQKISLEYRKYWLKLLEKVWLLCKYKN